MIGIFFIRVGIFNEITLHFWKVRYAPANAIKYFLSSMSILEEVNFYQLFYQENCFSSRLQKSETGFTPLVLKLLKMFRCISAQVMGQRFTCVRNCLSFTRLRPIALTKSTYPRNRLTHYVKCPCANTIKQENWIILALYTEKKSFDWMGENDLFGRLLLIQTKDLFE